MDIYDIGTKVSESAIALHLYNFETKSITPAWLHDRLGLRVEEQWQALQWPTNERVLAGVYETKRADWSGSIPRVLADGSVENLEMRPSTDVSAEEQIDLLLEGEASYSLPFASWFLPEEDFVVPLSGSLLGSMCGLVRGESQSCVTLSEEKFVFPAEAIAELQDRVQSLQKKIDAREAGWRRVAKSLAASDRAINVLRLVERAWGLIEGEKAASYREHIEGLRQEIETTRADVIDDLHGDESEAADAVLDMFERGELVNAVDKLAFDPLAIDSDEADELTTAVKFACDALARSSRADRLLRDHAWPAVAEVCRNPPYAFDRVVADLGSAELREELSSGWERTHEEVQKHFGAPTGESLLKKLAQGAKLYRSGTTVIGSALSEGVLVELWSSIDGTARYRGRRLAALMLRFVISSGIPDPQNVGLMVGGRLDFAKVLRHVDELGRAKDIDVFTKRLDRLKGLKLRDQFARTPSITCLRLIASVAMLWSVASDDDLDGQLRAWMLATSITQVVEDGVQAAIILKAYQGEMQFVTLSGDGSKVFGRLAVLLSLMTSIYKVRSDNAKLSDKFGLLATSMRVSSWPTMWLAEYYGLRTASGAALRIVSCWLAFYGALLGNVILIWALLPSVEIPKQGTQLIFERYFDVMLEDDGAFTAQAKNLRLAYARVPVNAMRLRFSRYAFPGLHDIAGKPGEWASEEPPTWHAARMLGFDAHEIAEMFDAPFEDIVAQGIPETLRGRRPPSEI